MSLSMVTVLMRPVCHAKMTKWRMAPARLSHQQTNQLMTVALISFARSSGAAGQALDGLAPRTNHSTCGAFV